MNITVLGAGSYGTAIANHLSYKNKNVVLWVRNKSLFLEISNTKINSRYLPKINLFPKLNYEKNLLSSLNHVSNNNSLLVIATPTLAFRSILRDIKKLNKIPKNFIWLCKGIENTTHLMLHQIVSQEFSGHVCNGVLSGPSFAEEVAKNLPTELVIASKSNTCKKYTTTAFQHNMMNIHSSSDIIGVEISGAIKNIIAIAIGISDKLRLGLNIRASLITRGFNEMQKLGISMGGKSKTFNGFAGIGDLVLTTTSIISRNYKIGEQLASGKLLKNILFNFRYVPEGVYCTKSIYLLSKLHKINMPIVEFVYSILFDKKSPNNLIKILFK